MKIAVIGTGYVGLVTGLCLAKGNGNGNGNVTCLDVDQQKIEKLKKGEPTFFEMDLETKLSSCLSKGLISFTSDYKDIADNDIYFVAVGTPPKENGQNDLTYVFNAIESILHYKNEDSNVIIVLKSTVEIGTAKSLKEKYKNFKNLKIVNNPEFLREGRAFDDFMNPDRIVIGSDDNDTIETIKSIYNNVYGKDKFINYVITDNTSAEMIKYASNSFLATKISFINEMAMLCDKVGADITSVSLGMGLDLRIGRDFLDAGCGYGGSCFPKDVKALKFIGQENNIPMNIISSAQKVNNEMKQYLYLKILDYFNNDIRGKSFAVWGLAFKPNTDDVREATSINMISSLSFESAKLNVYDPEAMENFKKYVNPKVLENVRFFDNKEDTIKNSENGLIILTEWKEFYNINLKNLRKYFKDLVIFDGRNMFRPTDFASDIDYIGIGQGK